MSRSANEPMLINQQPAHLPQAAIPTGHHWGDIQLELSLKPFWDLAPEHRQAVIREVLLQWRPLWAAAESVSFMLWIAEGSDVLEYDGDLDQPFEWARYYGAPNAQHTPNLYPETAARPHPDHAALGLHAWRRDPEGRCIHRRGYVYRDAPPQFTRRWLRGLVHDMKRIGGDEFGIRVEVGHTFDIGPEFAISRFKYAWHREILSSGPMFKDKFIAADAVLHADQRCYAAFPDGIPAGTPFGYFLGCQAAAYARDCGFDFLWLSNGFGFALEPHACVGRVFDGLAFDAAQLEPARQGLLTFWRELRRGLPDSVAVRCRGTNLATGIDIGSDGCPLVDMYGGGFGLQTPVNSPWAALDGNFGLELSGWMSHLPRHPGAGYRYRFYPHDPWWLNSPWLHRYARQPHDIYLPLAVALVTADGGVETPRDIGILTVDDSHGELPRTVAAEVCAHILRARTTAPDQCGPLVWLYPLDGYVRQAFTEGRPQSPWAADAAMAFFINEGVPVNSVIDLADLRLVLARDPAFACGRVALSVVPDPGSAEELACLEWQRCGGDLLLYGPVPVGSAFASLLQLAWDDPLEGDFVPVGDSWWGSEARRIRHHAVLADGGWSEVAAGEVLGGGPRHWQAAGSNGVRLYAAYVQAAVGGSLGWTRAANHTDEWRAGCTHPIRGPILRPLDRAEYLPVGYGMKLLLAACGWTSQPLDSAQHAAPACLTIHRSAGAFLVSCHQKNELERIALRTPLGAPLFVERRNQVVDGQTLVAGMAAWQLEARVFVRNRVTATIRCREVAPMMPGVHRRLLVEDVADCELWVFTPPAHAATVRIVADPVYPYMMDPVADWQWVDTAWGRVAAVHGANGSLLVEW
jgi:hypothetical protein